MLRRTESSGMVMPPLQQTIRQLKGFCEFVAKARVCSLTFLNNKKKYEKKTQEIRI